MDKKKVLIKEWLKKAEHDMGMAKLALENKEEYTDSICFHCQQYVEKTLKAYLIHLDLEFAKTHSLVYLLDTASKKEHISDELYSMSEVLEGYAVGIRYPGDGVDPTKEDAQEAYSTALKIQQIMNRKLRSYLLEMQNDKKKERPKSHEMEI